MSFELERKKRIWESTYTLVWVTGRNELSLTEVRATVKRVALGWHHTRESPASVSQIPEL
jgi:hypothetical protein